jgi:hypothetical protein
LNVFVSWLWSEKPAETAISAIGLRDAGKRRRGGDRIELQRDRRDGRS